MVKQIIELGSHIEIFKLNNEEKNLFLDAVNMLPITIYVRGDINNVNFLTAIDNDNTETARESFQKLTWKDVAKRLIIETKRVSKECNELHKKEKAKEILLYALKH